MHGPLTVPGTPPQPPARRRAGSVVGTAILFCIAGMLAGCQPQPGRPAGDRLPTATTAVGEPAAEIAAPAASPLPAASPPPAASPLPAPSADALRERGSTSTDSGFKAGGARLDPPPAAARKPRDPDQLQSITFADLEIGIKEDLVINRSMLTEKVRQLDGCRVRIRGFIFPGIFQQSGIEKFPLVMNTECKFGPGGQADHVIIVDMVKGVTASYTMRAIAVEGRLSVQPWTGPDGNTWSLYHIQGERID